MRRSYGRKNSTKILSLVTVVAIILFAAIYYLNDSSAPLNQAKDDVVIAEVAGQKIYKYEISRKFKEVFGNSQETQFPDPEKLSKEALEVLVREVYMEHELQKRAEESRIAKNPEVASLIEEAKNKVMRKAYVDSLVNQHVTDEAVKNKYVELTNEITGKKEYLTSHILVKTKQEADRLHKDISKNSQRKGGEHDKFSEYAKRYSIDQDSATKGGSLGYILENNLIKEMAEIVPNLKLEKVSDPVQTKLGWHLIRIDEVREAKPLPFESVKNNLKDQLIQDELIKINSEILGKVKVKILNNSSVKKKENEILIDDSNKPSKTNNDTAESKDDKANNSEESDLELQPKSPSDNKLN